MDLERESETQEFKKTTMRKTMKNVIFTLLFLAFIVSAVLLAYLYLFAPGDKGLSDDEELPVYEDLSGEWTANLDMKQQAAVTAFSWLQDIEGVSISLEDMESYMQDLTIQVNLTFEQTAHSEGILERTFRCNVLPESYEACNQAAYEAFAMAFRELLTERLRMAGYADGTDDEDIEALVTETFGMSTVSYLMACGPALLPSLEELQAQYDGSGTYEAIEGTLTRQFDSDQPVSTTTEHYIRNDLNLVLYEETGSAPYPIIYTLKQTPNTITSQ